MISFGYSVYLAPLDKPLLTLLRKWRNNYDIWKTCRQSDLISDYAQDKWFEKQANDPTIKMYTIACSSELVPVGVCGFTSIDYVNRRAEFSLYVAPENQKRGLGSAALKTLVCHGFQNLNLNLIWGESFADNSARETFKKLGFTEEGRRREFYFKGGEFVDAYHYSMTRKEFDLNPDLNKVQTAVNI